MQISHSYQGKDRVYTSSKSKIVIGRADQVKVPDLDLSDPKNADDCDYRVSRQHLRIGVDANGSYWIEDLGSKHGTWIGETDITGQGRCPLALGEVVVIGDTIVKVLEEAPASASPALPICLEVECEKAVNYSLIHAGFPFVENLKVINKGDSPLTGASVRLLLPGMLASEAVAIPALPGGGSYDVDPLPRFECTGSSMRDLPEQVRMWLEAQVDGQPVPVGPAVAVSVLPPNAWHSVGHDLALAGFVMPGCEVIEELRGKALQDLRRRLPGMNSFASALESDDPEVLRETMGAFYQRLCDGYRITYEYEPRTFAEDGAWQKLRFHHEVLSDQGLVGTCIDLVLLFAAALESVHRDPLILIVQTSAKCNHALVGCWRDGLPRSADGSPMYKAVFDDQDQQQVRQWIESDEILVLESIGFTRSQKYRHGMNFDDSRDGATQTATQYPLICAVDVSAARERNVTPMPFGKGCQFDSAASLALYRARRLAIDSQRAFLGVGHLLLGLLSLDGGRVPDLFEHFQDGLAGRVREKIENSLLRGAAVGGGPAETGNWQAVLKLAADRASVRGASPIIVTEDDLARAVFGVESGVFRPLAGIRAGDGKALSQERCLAALDQLTGQVVNESAYGDHKSRGD